MANFKNYSLKPDIAHFSLSLIGNLITFSDVVHKALVFCFLFIARCKRVRVFTVNKAISAIHRFRLIISTLQSGVSDLDHCCVTGILWSHTDCPISCSFSAFELFIEVGQSVLVFSFILFRSYMLDKPGCTSGAMQVMYIYSKWRR